MGSCLEAVNLFGGTSGAETLMRWGGRRDESGDSNHWLTPNCGNVARVEIAFGLIDGEMAEDCRLGGGRSGGRRKESRDSNHSCTLTFIHKYTDYLRVANNSGLKFMYIAIS